MAALSAEHTIVVVTGGDAPAADERSRLPDHALVIAADSGIEHAHALGLTVDVAVGDFDSVTPAALAQVEADGALVERHPAAKDATDLELALDAAMKREPERIVVFGGHGGRLDHFLGNALLLASPQYEGVGITAHMGGTIATVVRGEVSLTGSAGDLVSLLAIGGPARGVSTGRLLYPLLDAVLLPGSTRGISNEMLASTATVAVADGVVLAVQPPPSTDLSTKPPQEQ